jgi:hypothetical protein
MQSESVAYRIETKANNKERPMIPQRQLRDLISIGPAMLRDFELLGIRSVSQLAKQDPKKMYSRLSRLTGQRLDPCVLDTFQAAVAQARNPRLPAARCQWWFWSRKRKASA